MSEPLSAERFEQFVETYTENHAAIVGTLGDHTKRLDKIETRLAELADMDALRETVHHLETRIGILENTRSR